MSDQGKGTSGGAAGGDVDDSGAADRKDAGAKADYSGVAADSGGYGGSSEGYQGEEGEAAGGDAEGGEDDLIRRGGDGAQGG